MTTIATPQSTIRSAAPAAQPVANEALRNAISSRTRPPRPNVLTTSLTFGWRALLKIKHVPEQLFDVVASPIMFTLLFTYLFGGAISGSTGDYLQFFLPGILVQTVVFTSIYTGVALNNDIEKGVFDRFRSLPIWRPSALVGALLGDVVRFTVASIVTLTLGLILGFRPDGGVIGVVSAIALLLVFAFGLGWIFTTLGLLMRTPNAVMSVSMLLLFPLTFASNIFVDPATMPDWLENIVAYNPITRLVTAVRGLMDGAATTGQVMWVLIAAAILTVIFGPITMYFYRNKQ